MNNKQYSEEDIRQLEASKLLTEINKNIALSEEIVSRRKGWWKPSFLGMVVFLVMLASFGDFFSNLYQIASADKQALETDIKKLRGENDTLKARLANQSAVAATALNTNTKPKEEITESTLNGAVIVTRWGPTLQEAHAVLLEPFTKQAPEGSYAYGAQLGCDKPSSDLGLIGGQYWMGKWRLRDNMIQIIEKVPRPLDNGIIIEIDLGKRSANGRWPVTRTSGGVVESGVGEILFKGAM